jgi:hypothetical protein
LGVEEEGRKREWGSGEKCRVRSEREEGRGKREEGRGKRGSREDAKTQRKKGEC